MADIRPMTSDYEEYLRDESRTVGRADSISFPESEDEVRAVLRELRTSDSWPLPITVQGGRTGLAAGAVPRGGHILNLSKMNRILGLRHEGADADGHGGVYYLRVQPGVVLQQMRKDLEDKNIPTDGWDDESLAAWDELVSDREQFFPTDPTETSATIGGIVACNASGARSYHYGPARPHVNALRLVLADGDVLALQRGQVFAQGRSLDLTTESGRAIHLDLPTYTMPAVKNASGYYACDNEDALDIAIGSDGTLGVITEIELTLVPLPFVVWGVSCFFTSEASALDFTELVRVRIAHAAAIEFFDADALQILRTQRATSTAFSALPEVAQRFTNCIYVEIQCDDESTAYDELYEIGRIMGEVGANEEDTWVGRTDLDRETQRFFRHAVPESVNMLIDERRKTDPTITKLGSDMSVPDAHMRDIVAYYRRTLAEEGLQTAVWGHIGNNHLHVNVLPRDANDFARGKALYERWAKTVTEMGGAVSAEHGIGKIKVGFLRTMYGDAHIREMARLKRELDPEGVFGQGNLFAPDTPDIPADTTPRDSTAGEEA